MEPRVYVAAYLERTYLAAHPELTVAARELVHDDIPQRLEKYASDAHAQALVAYTNAHEHLMRQLRVIEDEADDNEFDRKRVQLFDETRLALFKIAETDQLCIDATLVGLLLSNISIDACLGELLKLEQRVHRQLVDGVPGFSDEGPHFWEKRFVAERTLDNGDPYATAAALTVQEPTLIGWLHTLEALAQMCLASARYRAAERYARLVLRAAGYPSHAEGTVFLALARLEDEDGFFAFAHELEGERGNQAAAVLDDSPWFLLARTLLLYKLGRRRPAKRALRDFATRCDGGAFFLLNPTYMAPYLPVRPQPRTSWDLSHQAAWDADGIIVDTPDFVPWAESVDGVYDASERFADRNGF